MNEDKLNLLAHEEYDKDFDELTEFQKTDIEAKVADEHKGSRKGASKDKITKLGLQDVFVDDGDYGDALDEYPEGANWTAAQWNAKLDENSPEYKGARKGSRKGDTFEEKMSRGRNTSGAYANVVAKIGAHKRAITGESRQGSRKGS